MAITRLRETRQNQGLTLLQLSFRAHVSVSSIVRAEKGGTIERRLRGRLAQALKTPLSELFPEGPDDGAPLVTG